MDTQLREKIERTFGTLAVDKRESLQAGLQQMPRFVTEYLLARARVKNPALGLDEVRDKIKKFSVDADRKGELISKLMIEGRAQLIGLVEVEPRPDRNEHIARVAQLDGHELQVSESLVSQFPELLYGGLWGTAVLRYDKATSKPRMVLEEFTPYQLTQPDLNLFREARSEFTLDEWIALLITSAGYSPAAFRTPRLRLLALCRLIPLAQSNLNLIEMGPRGTGKSYLLRNLSSRVFLLAGARATPATLLYDLNRRRMGIVGRKKVVVFDEIGATVFPDKSLVASLKDYMASGNLARAGSPETVADCSFVFAGNLDLDDEGLLPSRGYRHLFEMLPSELCDVAIADRIHGFLPGWELPKIAPNVLADGVGLVSDYFGEVLGHLRAEHRFDDYVMQNVTIHESLTRDQVAVQRIAAGLLKLLYPNMDIDPSGLDQVKQVAVELRQRVHDQMVAMAPGEYRPKVLGFPGMKPHEANDIGKVHPIEAQDVAANLQAQVGKITILLVSERGGGDVGFVECSHVAGSGYGVSGLRGAALQQSVQAAYDALLKLGPEFGLPADRLRQARMAVHLVNIAEPKDGPSAGLAFALAMLSAATGRAIVPGLAVTGELSIHGNVNKVGGVVEKLAAAKRHQRKIVIIPASNAGELARLPDLHAGLDVKPVHTLAEAVKIALTA